MYMIEGRENAQSKWQPIISTMHGHSIGYTSKEEAQRDVDGILSTAKGLGFKDAEYRVVEVMPVEEIEKMRERLDNQRATIKSYQNRTSELVTERRRLGKDVVLHKGAAEHLHKENEQLRQAHVDVVKQHSRFQYDLNNVLLGMDAARSGIDTDDLLLDRVADTSATARRYGVLVGAATKILSEQVVEISKLPLPDAEKQFLSALRNVFYRLKNTQRELSDTQQARDYLSKVNREHNEEILRLKERVDGIAKDNKRLIDERDDALGAAQADKNAVRLLKEKNETLQKGLNNLAGAYVAQAKEKGKTDDQIRKDIHKNVASVASEKFDGANYTMKNLCVEVSDEFVAVQSPTAPAPRQEKVEVYDVGALQPGTVVVRAKDLVPEQYRARVPSEAMMVLDPAQVERLAPDRYNEHLVYLVNEKGGIVKLGRKIPVHELSPEVFKPGPSKVHEGASAVFLVNGKEIGRAQSITFSVQKLRHRGEAANQPSDRSGNTSISASGWRPAFDFDSLDHLNFVKEFAPGEKLSDSSK